WNDHRLADEIPIEERQYPKHEQSQKCGKPDSGFINPHVAHRKRSQYRSGKRPPDFLHAWSSATARNERAQKGGSGCVSLPEVVPCPPAHLQTRAASS